MAWNCPVCGFSEKGDQAPANCPVCGTAGDRFTSSDRREEQTAPTAEIASGKAPGTGSSGQWKCPVCGYIRKGEKTDEPCPVCGAAAERFFSPDAPAKEPKAEAPVEAQPTAGGQERKWRCTVCGYIHTGPEPPEKCPVCGSPSSVFVEITPEPEPEPAPQTAATPATGPPGFRDAGEPSPASPWQQRFDLLRDKMVELHAHPIAVHIPNGLLPVAVLFLLLSMLFGCPSLSTASFYNLIVVALAMPVVLFSGYNDWQRRFGGTMTPVFMIKIVCGAVIAAGSFILVLWRLLNPTVTAAGSGGRWGYLLVHLVLLAAAGMAGYQGGKLVIFPDGSGVH